MTEALQKKLALSKLRQKLLDLPRYKKRTLLVIADFLILSGVLWAVISIRYNTVYVPDSLPALGVLAAGPILTIIAFAYAGLYRLVTRYLGSLGHTRIIGSVTLAVLIWSLGVLMVGQYGLPRTVIVGYGFIAAGAIALSRHYVAWLLKSSGLEIPKSKRGEGRHTVIIYGAGHDGIELAKALTRVPGYEIVNFIDTSPTLWGQYIMGIKVHRPDRLVQLVSRYGVKEILLAVPTSERHERRLILKELEKLPVAVKVLPSLEDLASGRVAVTDLRPLDVQDLLGRDSVPPIPGLLSRNTSDKCVMVTGAGGSVGSELVRQLLRNRPAQLVLFEQSEPALYDIELEVKEAVQLMKGDGALPEIVSVLGSVLDGPLVANTLGRYGVNTIYHAAAYKHVPIVEHNPAAGLRNNVFGTEVVARAAEAACVERMVLISTDKAVRPTNVMGASKRLAELVLQASAGEQSGTVFTMVRFGNVLDSSGSVVRRFRQQIKAGGPVTVTHPEVVRYFMSIPEAAELVIQAGAMAHGGDMFLLDMGEPVKIDDLARLMVRLSGFEVRDEEHPEGDIPIVYTGLRPGEKLYEELLIGAHARTTEHPRILRCDEPALSAQELRSELDLLRAAMDTNDIDTMRAVLMRTVEGYQPDLQADVPGHKAPTWVPLNRTIH